MDATLQHVIQQFRQGVEVIFGDRLVRVILFGSRARGDARADSDVDMLIVLRGEHSETEADRVAELESDLCIRYGPVLASVIVSQEKYEARQEPLYRNVEREGVAI